MGNTTVEIPTRFVVLGMAHADGTLLAEEVYPVAEGCGLSTDQVRSCLRRLVSEELFTRTGEGQDARFTATEEGMRTLDSTIARMRLAWAQDAEGRGWDRTWHLVAFAIPETKRAGRDAFRDRLTQLGGAPIQNGLYVSAHAWEDEVRHVAEGQNVAEFVAQAPTDELEVGGVTDPTALASRLWALDELADRYSRFIEMYRGTPDALDQMRKRHERLTEADFLPGTLLIGLEFNACFAQDPLLPPELLPRPWPGREARELLRRSRRLGMLIREKHEKPALFSNFERVADLP